MKIIYLHQYFNTPEMSGGTRSYEMARRLVDNGHEVHMITTSREHNSKNGWTETTISGINVHWLKVPYSNNMSFNQRILAFFKFAFRSAKKASSIDADLIFATSTPLTIAIPAVYASKKQKIPMVFEVRDLWPELPIAMGALKNPITRATAVLLEKLAYKNAQSIIALSPGMKEGIINAGYPSNKIAVIPNSSDIELFSKRKNKKNSFLEERLWLQGKTLIVYAGTFGAINGVGYSIDLAKELYKISPQTCILLIGSGKELNSIRKKAELAGVLNKNLFIENEIPKNEIPQLFEAASMMLGLFIDKPEMRVNSSNKFFDALAASKPIIINYGGWQKDLLEKYDAGIVIWQLQPKAAAEIITEKINNKTWLAKASKSSRFMAENLFSRDELFTQLESVFEATVENKENNIANIVSNNYE